ncbi:MAG: arsenate reductase ArsC [Proteobacteria bacterium]|nr:arsenate reductase ArsC [Desulfobulbaceae bacterium]MBU4152900.1 arsenate reductase ArsC [Pseudomonadota bacterium]
MVRILFVCIENSNRSQMAEAFARIEGAEKVEVASAGSNPATAVNPKAVAAMAERGYDLGTHAPKSLADVGIVSWDYVVTMGCGDDCPLISSRQRLDWQLPDPREMDEYGYRTVCDEIERLVRQLIAGLP